MASLLLLNFSRNKNKMNRKSNVKRMAIITQYDSLHANKTRS